MIHHNKADEAEVEGEILTITTTVGDNLETMDQLSMGSCKEQSRMEGKVRITAETDEVVVKEDVVNTAVVVTDEVHQETILSSYMEEMSLLIVQHNRMTKQKHLASLHILKVLWQRLLKRQIQQMRMRITSASSVPTRTSTTRWRLATTGHVISVHYA